MPQKQALNRVLIVVSVDTTATQVQTTQGTMKVRIVCRVLQEGTLLQLEVFFVRSAKIRGPPPEKVPQFVMLALKTSTLQGMERQVSWSRIPARKRRLTTELVATMTTQSTWLMIPCCSKVLAAHALKVQSASTNEVLTTTSELQSTP